MPRFEPQDERTLSALLGQHPGVELAILFGSVATGQAQWQSDIDLAISLGRPATAQERIELIEQIAMATGRPVDLIDLTQVGEPLLGQILARGQRVIGSDEAYARLLSRHLIEQADFLPYRNRILEERRRAWIGN